MNKLRIPAFFLLAAWATYGQTSSASVVGRISDASGAVVANAQVRRFFQDCGFTVLRDLALERPSPVQIAHTTEAMCRKAILDLDGDDVDAIVQVGTNLSMVRMAAAAELFLGKPVIAINTATYWHALRAAGLDDRIDGYGTLLSHH